MKDKEMLKGTLYIVSGPSGSGKTSLVKAMADPNDPFIASLLDEEKKEILTQISDSNMMQKAITHTTRDIRGGEVDGIDYHFVSKEDFKNMIADDGFLEYAEVFDKFYGTSKKEVESRISAGENVVLIIDWQGHRNIRQNYNNKIHSIFLLPPSLDILEQRLIDRNEDSSEKIKKRLEQASSDIEKAKEYDTVIVNDDFIQAAIKMKDSIVGAHNKKKFKKTRP